MEMYLYLATFKFAMARANDREKAIELRKKGKTYSQIRIQLNVAKSTLSDWLRDYPLTDVQVEKLERTKLYSKQLAIEKTRLIKQRKRETRLANTYTAERTRWNNLTEKELELAGIFLYWGEGSKRLNGSIAVSNTDPRIIQFAKYWIVNCLHVPKEKIKVDLHLYNDMAVSEEIAYWSESLSLPTSQFRKPYIKKSVRTGITHKGYAHGTCSLVVNDVLLKEKVLMAIKAIADDYIE